MIHHPRFGKIRSIVLTRAVQAGEELFTHYGFLESYVETEDTLKKIFDFGKMLNSFNMNNNHNIEWDSDSNSGGNNDSNSINKDRERYKDSNKRDSNNNNMRNGDYVKTLKHHIKFLRDKADDFKPVFDVLKSAAQIFGKK